MLFGVGSGILPLEFSNSASPLETGEMHKAREMPKEDFRREVENCETGQTAEEHVGRKCNPTG
jgi:hypothetical protein